MNVSKLLIGCGLAVGIGAFGYKTAMKSGLKKEVPATVDAAVWVGLGAAAVGIALKFLPSTDVKLA